MSDGKTFEALLIDETTGAQQKVQIPLVDARAVKRAPVVQRAVVMQLQTTPFALFLTERLDYSVTPFATIFEAHAVVSALGQRRMKEGTALRLDVPAADFVSATDRLQAASIALFTVTEQLRRMQHALWANALDPQIMALFP